MGPISDVQILLCQGHERSPCRDSSSFVVPVKSLDPTGAVIFQPHSLSSLTPIRLLVIKCPLRLLLRWLSSKNQLVISGLSITAQLLQRPGSLMTSSSPSAKRSLTSGEPDGLFPSSFTFFQDITVCFISSCLLPFRQTLSFLFLCVILRLFCTSRPTFLLQFCRGWLWFVAYSGPVISVAAVDALLIMRLFAIYQRDRRMLVFLVSLYIIEFSIIISIASYLLSGTQAATPQTISLPLTGCLATKSPNMKISLIAWIPNILIACTFFVLTLYKFVQLIRIVSGSSFWSTLGEVKNISPVMALFVRDGAMCFGMVFAAVLLNTIFIITSANDPMNQMGTAWLIATYAIAASRLVLNLHGFRDGLGSTTVNNKSIEMSAIKFKNGPPKRNMAMESGSQGTTLMDTAMNTRFNSSAGPLDEGATE